LDATRIMLDVHRKGKGVVGTYTYDIAATKINRVHEIGEGEWLPAQVHHGEGLKEYEG